MSSKLAVFMFYGLSAWNKEIWFDLINYVFCSRTVENHRSLEVMRRRSSGDGVLEFTADRRVERSLRWLPGFVNRCVPRRPSVEPSKSMALSTQVTVAGLITVSSVGNKSAGAAAATWRAKPEQRVEDYWDLLPAVDTSARWTDNW